MFLATWRQKKQTVNMNVSFYVDMANFIILYNIIIHWGSGFWPPGELEFNNHSFSSLYVSTRESHF